MEHLRRIFTVTNEEPQSYKEQLAPGPVPSSLSCSAGFTSQVSRCRRCLEANRLIPSRCRLEAEGWSLTAHRSLHF
jgi:hypothetical protein